MKPRMRMQTFNELYESSGYRISRTGKPGSDNQYSVYYKDELFVEVPDIAEAVSEVEYEFLKKDSTQFG